MNWILKYFENIINIRNIVDINADIGNISSISSIITQVVDPENSLNLAKSLKTDFENILNIALGFNNINGTALYLFDRREYKFDLILAKGEKGNRQSYHQNLAISSELVKYLKEVNTDIIFNSPHKLLYREDISDIEQLIAFPVRLKGIFIGFSLFESNYPLESGDKTHNALLNLNEMLIRTLSTFLDNLISENKSNLFKAFFEINEIISIINSKTKIFELLSQMFIKIFNCDRISFFSFDLNNQKVKIEKVMGEPDLIEDDQIIQGLSYLQQAIVSSKQAFFVENIKEDQAYGSRYPLPDSEKYDLRSVIACPIIAKGIVIGGYQMEFLNEGKAREDFLPIFLKLGYIIGNVIEKVHLYRKMEKMATTDFLTGLVLKREMVKILNNEMIRSRRNKQPLAFLMIDVDKFKSINDNYGHLVGDLVLKKVAEVITSSIREIDIGCRFAGDEFSVILLNNNIEQALISAERIRKNVKSIPVMVNEQTINVTLSIGIAVFDNDAKSYTELIEKADLAMYTGRKGGRRDLSMVYVNEMNNEDLNDLKIKNKR